MDYLLLLTRQVQIDWFKLTVLGEVETAVRLGMKSRFAYVRLSTGDCILGLLSLFFNKVKLQHLSFLEG